MKRLRIVLIIIPILVLSLILTNYFVNPFGVFNSNGLRSQQKANKYERYYINPLLKSQANNSYEYVVFGTSNTKCYAKDYMLTPLLDKNIQVVALDGLIYGEMFRLIDFYTDIYPKDTTLLVSLEFGALADEFEQNQLLDGKGTKMNFDELIFLLFSKEAIICSFDALSDYVQNKISEIQDKFFNHKDTELSENSNNGKSCRQSERRPRFRQKYKWEKWIYYEKNMEYVAQIKKIAESKSFNSVFYVNPDHSYILADIYLSGAYDNVEKYKRELVKITPFYDFLYVNKYNNDPISADNPYWLNSVHADYPLGNIIIKKLILNDNSFGIYVTQDNIETVLRKEKEDLQKYIREHKKEIDTFRSYEYRDMYTEYVTICE